MSRSRLAKVSRTQCAECSHVHNCPTGKLDAAQAEWDKEIAEAARAYINAPWGDSVHTSFQALSDAVRRYDEWCAAQERKFADSVSESPNANAPDATM